MSDRILATPSEEGIDSYKIETSIIIDSFNESTKDDHTVTLWVTNKTIEDDYNEIYDISLSSLLKECEQNFWTNCGNVGVQHFIDTLQTFVNRMQRSLNTENEAALTIDPLHKKLQKEYLNAERLVKRRLGKIKYPKYFK